MRARILLFTLFFSTASSAGAARTHIELIAPPRTAYMRLVFGDWQRPFETLYQYSDVLHSTTQFVETGPNGDGHWLPRYETSVDLNFSVSAVFPILMIDVYARDPVYWNGTWSARALIAPVDLTPFANDSSLTIEFGPIYDLTSQKSGKMLVRFNNGPWLLSRQLQLPVSVPEPAAGGVMLVALMGCLARRKR